MGDGDQPIAKGLEGIVVDESRISMVDGEQGDIWYAGYHIDDLATEASFEEVLSLLWEQRLPTQVELSRVEASLRDHRELNPAVRGLLEDAGPESAPMDLLRTAVSALAVADPDPRNREALRGKLQRITAAIPTVIAAMHRLRTGAEPVTPTGEHGHAASFLHQFDGSAPDPDRVRALEVALVLYAEHGMNASTFASRVTASTLANPYASITSAIGTLEGPLHGGATEDVIDVLQEIGDPENAASWVDDRLEAGETVPGFGHRVYRVPDPRCKHFKREIEALDPDPAVARLYETAEALRAEMEERLGDKGIYPNTDLYSGIFFRALGIPPALFTTIFTMGRVAGWAAHVLEQTRDNRLIRPRVEYVGEIGKEYVPVEERN